MPAAVRTLVPLLQLTRLAMVFTAVGDIWLVVLWARLIEGRADPHWQLGQTLGLTAGVAIGMYVFGMVLNDVMDARRDRLFAPERPIPSRRITITTALAIALSGLLLGLLCAVALGEVNTLLCLLCAGLIVFYNAAGKHLPAIGLIALGLVRAAHMLIGEPTLAFCWPVWLVFTHVVTISALAYRLERKRPVLIAHEAWAIALGWAFWTLAMVFWMAQRGGLTPRSVSAPWVWLGPVAAGLTFLAILYVMIQRSGPTQATGKAVMRWGLGWLIVYDGSWFASIGRWREAGVFVALAAATVICVQVIRSLESDRHPGELFLSDRRTG